MSTVVTERPVPAVRRRRTGVARDVDAIVIGSGFGGLAAASLMGRLHARRVLVLERHWRPGGFTQAFSRPGGWSWDVGLHYVGEVHRPGTVTDVCRLVTGGVRWERMRDPFERLVFPGLEVELRSGKERLLEELCLAFPGEATAIRRWMRDVRRAASWGSAHAMRALAPPWLGSVAEALLARSGRLARTTTGAYLAARFWNPRLRAIVGARWCDWGLPPAQSAFLAHAAITTHYLDGASYPVGGADALVSGARRVIEASGGEVRVAAEVERILVRDGRAAGVRLRGGEEVAAPLVISDAGARTTYLRLLPEGIPLPFRSALRALPTGMATVTLYLGLSRSPAALGVHGENFWIHDELDHDRLWARRDEVLEGRAPLVYVSFPSMKDPAARAHTAEIVAPVSAEAFARWEGTRWRRRGAEYEALKERIAGALLEAAERRLPGLSALVAYRELSTPLSTEAFTGHPGGESYGIPLTPERLRLRWLGPRTPVPGLYLAGADALSFGIVGAMMGGVFAVAAAAGMGTFGRIRAEARRLGTASASAAELVESAPRG